MLSSSQLLLCFLAQTLTQYASDTYIHPALPPLSDSPSSYDMGTTARGTAARSAGFAGTFWKQKCTRKVLRRQRIDKICREQLHESSVKSKLKTIVMHLFDANIEYAFHADTFLVLEYISMQSWPVSNGSTSPLRR